MRDTDLPEYKIKTLTQ